MFDYAQQPHVPSASPRNRRWRFFIIVIILVIAGGAAAYGVQRFGHATISVINRIGEAVIPGDTQKPRITPISDDPEYELPKNSSDRLDILLLGIRGKDDTENGGNLTDTIMLFSLDAKSGRATLTSIPRDLTVRITDTKTEKINTAYAHLGLGGTKKLYSRVTGVGIDFIALLDFSAFKQLIDTLGGITITLEKPFTETQQWGYEFTLPAGTQQLTGEQALYYARSRYGSSDFDRSRRQMQVMLAMKEKAAALNLTSDPLRALELANTLRKHIETDLGIFDISTVRQLLAQQNSLGTIRRYQLTTENVLYETKVDGIYELLPRGGSLAAMKQFFTTVLSDHPILATPSPSPSATP